MIQELDLELSTSPCPVFLLGDLNSPVSGAAYQTIASRMQDLRHACRSTYGHYNTCTGFDGRKEDLSRIDHIFGSAGGGWTGSVYAVEESHFEDDIWLSDHRLVMADVFIDKHLSPEGKDGRE